MKKEIRVRRVYEPPTPEDGLRVLVDRVWPRGLTREQVRADRWLKEIAPSRALRTWFGHDPEKWEAFQERYFAELDAQPALVEQLREAARASVVTLLYSARDTDRNQAVALKAYLER